MITELKNEFIRITAALEAEFKSLAVDELELAVQSYPFDVPLINMSPIGSINSVIGQSGVLVWSGGVTLQFLKTAPLNATENEKDVIIDQMIALSVLFMRKFSKNEKQVFNNPQLNMTNRAIRFKTANYCVGWEVVINFTTGCNRF
jgi:hypothetical protein